MRTGTTPNQREQLARGISTIAIDGPVAAGKTAVGRELAHSLGFAYLDTGIMYRAITWLALHTGVSVKNETSLGELARINPVKMEGNEGNRVLVAGQSLGPELRESPVDRNVSLVSRASQVRKELVNQQRQIASQGKIVMVGRDIGTVVLPDADLKVYLTASPEIRAHRRWQEMRDRGQVEELEAVLSETLARDDIDSNRDDSPLKPAKDAWQLNTNCLDIEQVVQEIIARAKGQ
ncbi:MAG: cytidylate kinase [SAR202 cluster bacterium Io17-Chloro-G6]|nr:MAG: cytidylate kinase [SAR202 cluster bacterium Io17-Chloro-G6]